MRKQETDYLLSCIRQGNRMIVCSYLKSFKDQDIHLYNEALRELRQKDPKLVASYLEDPETVSFFKRYGLPIHEKIKSQNVIKAG